MAWVVGVLLVLLVLVGMPLKYIWPDVWLFGEPLGEQVVFWTGVPHGWLYLVLLISAFNLKYKAKWEWGWFIKIALAGTVPFLSFVAEHFATKDVKRRIAAAEEKQARRKNRKS
ncbi:MAG: DUF3817 domain-containing protein, partial [Propionibacterium sp.]|nr:DUF3817 domain-containing protein [Propionibacterium sp.]